MRRIKNVLIPFTHRSDYNLVYPVIKALENKGIKVHILITGPYASEQIGHNIKDFEKDGINVEFTVNTELEKFDRLEMANNLSIIIKETAKILAKLKPDFVYIQGDRMESLGITLAAAYLHIPMSQTHAGEITSGGHIDDLTRHVITKYASVIFTAAPQASKRVIAMGEEGKRVFYVGAPGLDSILIRKATPLNELMKKYGIPRKYGVLIQHSITGKEDRTEHDIRETLKSIKESDLFFVVSYPNHDAGAKYIFDEFEKTKFDNVKICKNFLSEDFIGLMKHAEVLIGNSSCGIVEAASYGLPVVNIGERQSGRDQSGNVIDVDNNANEILKAIKKATSNEFKEKCKKVKNIYGDGHTSERIAKIINNIDLDNDFLRKKIVL